MTFCPRMDLRKVIMMGLQLILTLNAAMGGALAGEKTPDKEFSLDSKLTLVEGEGHCGRLLCEARAAVTSLTITKVNVRETQDKVLVAVTKSKPNISVDDGEIIGTGDLKEGIANISLLLRDEACRSCYFVCKVNYTARSGQTAEVYSITGPGKAPALQFTSETDQENPITVKETISAPTKTGNPYLSELWYLGEKITKVEGKFGTLSDRLEKRLRENIDSVQRRAGALENSVLERVNSVETDFSSRVSRLEDRVSSILLSESPSSRSDVSQSLEDIERRLDEVTNKLHRINATEAVDSAFETQRKLDLPTVCEPGMGDDVTKQYPRYVIMPHEELGHDILCDTQTDGGGWIIFQRRAVGDVDFFRDWTSYKEGFGSLTGDFWMGNDALFSLTNKHPYEIRLDMRNKGREIFASYSNFRIADEAKGYKLELGPLKGASTETGDGFTYHNGMRFSTFDRDYDDLASLNCAVGHHGAWWYKSCHGVNLNGAWGVQAYKGVSWKAGKAWYYLSFSEMKIRRSHGSA